MPREWKGRLTGEDLDAIEARCDRLYALANACKGQGWYAQSGQVDDYMRFINDRDTFPGGDIRLLLAEVDRLKGLLDAAEAKSQECLVKEADRGA